MPSDVFTKTLSDDRRVLIGWSVGATLAGVMYASFYPQLADGQMAQAVANYPEVMREAFRLDDLTSAAGYLGSSVFGLILPLIAMFYGAATGARATAADEETGRLDLLLAYPIGRTAFLLQRFAALTAGAFGLAALVCAGMLAIRGPAGLDSISVTQFAAQCLQLALLAVTFGALAIGVGAATGRRALVFIVTAVIGVLAYALYAFAGQLGIGGARRVSPFHYYIGGEPLRHGVQWADAAILLATAGLFVAAGAFWFNRRDINR
ncbi:ABC transporter permease subunit [Actinoplanes sp. NPDC049316]|uniref:ABC transporter permease subunit n=1 Tax=Actinoplanes sp. NPDC049316 TaxID=3154727 RepID=UPI0034490627